MNTITNKHNTIIISTNDLPEEFKAYLAQTWGFLVPFGKTMKLKHFAIAIAEHSDNKKALWVAEEIKGYLRHIYGDFLICGQCDFSSIPVGADFTVGKDHYRKTRPWSPQQWNASLLTDENADKTFFKFEDNQMVLVL
jgi:hypothetical protein